MKCITKTSVPLTRLIMVGKPFWVSEKKKEAIFLLLSILGLLGAVSALAVCTNFVAGRFMTAIQAKDVVSFYWLLVAYVMSMAVAAPIGNYYGYLRTRLALSWRKWLVKCLVSRSSFIRVVEKLLKPQRGQIAQDVDIFCNMSVGLFISFLDAIITVVTFSAVLWSISPFLMKVVFMYSLMGCIITAWIGNRLVGLNQEHIALETNMRYILMEVEVEPTAKSSERRQRAQILKSLCSCIGNAESIMFLNRTLGFFTSGYNMLVAIIPAAIAAPMYFQGQMEFGDIVRAGMAFTQVFGGMTLFVNQFNPISAYKATIDRLGLLVETLDKADAEAVQQRTHPCVTGS
jgi:vitamin B12/bleomycin/antimicrobial peptide transport system ATP-binding/permease protein